MTSDLSALIEQNIGLVQARIAESAGRAGRDPREVLLIGVTKTHGIDVIEAAYRAGLRHFGENRVEEAEAKIRNIQLADITWHFIGHIQSRKVQDIVSLFDRIHSIERQKIALRMGRMLEQRHQVIPAMIEVNLSGEATKDGYDVSYWQQDRSQREAFFEEVAALFAIPFLSFDGLMTIAPYTTEPESVRPIFRELRLLRDALQDRFPDHPLGHLSMGMSGDFEVAIQEGATMVRLGTILFGERNVPTH